MQHASRGRHPGRFPLRQLRIAVTLSALAAVAAGMFAGCGSESTVIAEEEASTDARPPTDAQGPDAPGADGGAADGGDGGTDGARDGAVIDGSRADAAACVPSGGGCSSSLECCTANCDATTKLCDAPVGTCKSPGEACASGVECCTFSCVAGACEAKQCVADGLACGASGECCGGNCQPDALGGGTCQALNPGCKTSGNPCGSDGECCSAFCNGGVCSARPSFCTQPGDVCSNNAECCTGACRIAAGATLGVCGAVPNVPGSPNCDPAGTLCTASSSSCGGSCCSRKCAIYAPSGRSICQPASGCRPTGEICVTSLDCCGSATLPDGTLSEVTCARANPADVVGKCDNGKRCSPAGSICKLATTSCNATDRCCSGTVQQNPLRCQQDALGVPRCLIGAIDCTTAPPPPAGTACASSADCCGNPCTPNPAGGFMCGDVGSCVPVAGACTTHADCCPGTPCVFAPGSSSGRCGGVLLPDGGVVPVPDAGVAPDGGGGTDAGGPPGCALYGQVCTLSGDCCDGVPCTGGRCRTP